MYSLGAYFLEVLLDSRPGNSWTGDAQFSKHDDVPKVIFPTRLFRGTKTSAEQAVVEWARYFVATSSEVIEAALRLREKRTERD
jgi:hypothetical protein